MAKFFAVTIVVIAPSLNVRSAPSTSAPLAGSPTDEPSGEIPR